MIFDDRVLGGPPYDRLQHSASVCEWTVRSPGCGIADVMRCPGRKTAASAPCSAAYGMIAPHYA